MEEFHAQPNRDAYAVIRGFVYQVDWTILRWCELRDHEHLELECGEDIDVVANALEAEESERFRTLEQVKHREQSVTLVSPVSLTAVANFQAHREDNPTQKLRFRFCTCARTGLEQSDPFGGRPGIEVWEALRARDPASRREAGELETLKQLLAGRPAPHSCREETWRRFHSWLDKANQQQLAELVGHFEWAVGKPHADSMADEVRRELYLKGLCQDEAGVQELHARLFLKVMRLLSTKGHKSLNRRQLQDEAALPAMRDADRRLLRFLAAEVFTFGSRLRNVENQVIVQKEAQHQVLQELAVLTRTVSSTRVAETLSLPLSLQAPPLPDKLLPRKKMADGLESLLAESHWLALRGASGAGKTQAARLLYARCTAQKLWLSLRGLDEMQAAHQVTSLLRHQSGVSQPDELTSLVESAVGALPSGSLIVFDDLPQTSTDGWLSNLVTAIADACSSSDVYLITTSHYDVERFCSPAKPAAGRIVPPLAEAEIRELLALNDCPDEILGGDAPVDLLRTTQGHPWLAVAAVDDLRSRSWKQETRNETPHSEPGLTSVLDATLRRLLESVGDELAREMLYRLSRVTGAFGARILNAVSAAPPSIDKPRERFLKVEGPWIERHADDEYSVTPLISPISETELATDVAVAVYNALAQEVTTRETLSVIDAGLAVDYLAKSGQPQQAALFALYALQSARDLPAEDLRHLLDAAWRTRKIPNGVSLTLKLCLRTQHILLSDKPDESFLNAAVDASELMRTHDDAAAWAKASLVVLGGASLAEHDFSRACLHIRLLMPLRQLVTEQLPKVGDTVGYALWTIVGWITTPKHLLGWLRCVKSMDDEGAALAFGWEPAIEGCGVAINGPWTAMHLSNTPKRSWRQLFRVYRAAASVAVDMNIDMLWGRSVVAQIIVAAEYLDDLSLAESIARDALAREPLSKPNEFLIRDALGRQYLYHKKNELAVEQLELALAAETQEYPSVRSRTHLELGSLKGKTDAARGVSHAEQSVALARSEPRVSEESLIISLGELAIACWLQDDWLGAFGALDEAAERLFATKEASFDVRNVASRLGHCVTYLSTLALTGEPPEEQRYSVRPFRRFMMGWNRMAADHYDERDFSSHYDGIFVALAGLAVVVGNKQRVTYWSGLGWEEARRNGHLVEQGLAGHASFAVLLTKSEYEPALDTIREATNANWAVHILRHEKHDLHSRLTAKAVLGNQPNQRWHGAERGAIQQGLLPVLLQIAANHLEDVEDATAAATRVAEYVRSFDGDVALSKEWATARQFVEAPWNGDSTWEPVKLEAEKWSEAESGGTRYLGLLSATLHPDIPLSEAAVLHTRILAYLSKQFGFTSGVNEWISVRFFASYWRESAKHLQSQALVERSLRESSSLACNQRLRVIARVALGATETKLPNSQKAAKDWLRSHN